MSACLSVLEISAPSSARVPPCWPDAVACANPCLLSPNGQSPSWPCAVACVSLPYRSINLRSTLEQQGHDIGLAGQMQRRVSQKILQVVPRFAFFGGQLSHYSRQSPELRDVTAGAHSQRRSRLCCEKSRVGSAALRRARLEQIAWALAGLVGVCGLCVGQSLNSVSARPGNPAAWARAPSLHEEEQLHAHTSSPTHDRSGARQPW